MNVTVTVGSVVIVDVHVTARRSPTQLHISESAASAFRPLQYTFTYAHTYIYRDWSPQIAQCPNGSTVVVHICTPFMDV